ncbi:hypothetical protein SALBM135S_01407 [Streptomyces alboniger]
MSPRERVGDVRRRPAQRGGIREERLESGQRAAELGARGPVLQLSRPVTEFGRFEYEAHVQRLVLLDGTPRDRGAHRVRGRAARGLVQALPHGQAPQEVVHAGGQVPVPAAEFGDVALVGKVGRGARRVHPRHDVRGALVAE